MCKTQTIQPDDGYHANVKYRKDQDPINTYTDAKHVNMTGDYDDDDDDDDNDISTLKLCNNHTSSKHNTQNINDNVIL